MKTSSFQQPRSALKLPEHLWDLLCCPICRSSLLVTPAECRCTNDQCAANFPVVDGQPVLINEATSIFSLDDFVAHRNTTFVEPPKLLASLAEHLPGLTYNYKAKTNYRRFAEMLLQKAPRPRVLVIGGSIVGAGMEVLQDYRALELIESDVSFGPQSKLIADAHDLPFKDGSLDGVVIQAVLNCVVDPFRCVDEIHRVLKDEGLVYSETSFMQPVLDGRYDFTRFTYLGYRRLFRKFDDIDSGSVGGPGMAMALLYRAFLLSFARGKLARGAVSAFARLSAFWLKYVDACLVKRPEALDGTSGCYFLGKKSQRILSDRELMGLYKGGQPRIGEDVATTDAGGSSK